MVDTTNQGIVSWYFDKVQDEIKKLIDEDNDMTSEEIEIFNNEIFNQSSETSLDIKKYINDASTNNLDIKGVAKTLYDKFKTQIKNNVFINKNDVQNVPNKLLGERKYIMNFEKFNMLK